MTSNTSETYGFGLHFVKTMVESYGGEIWFEESDHGGARAVVELPALTEQVDSEASA